MSETTIILKDVIGTDLGPRNKIETLFNNIDNINITALKFIFHELIANIYDHSEFENAIVIGRNNGESFDFIFIDDGISIPCSLTNNNYIFETDSKSVMQAINGLSTKNVIGFIERGTGLNNTINITINGAEGAVLILSRHALLHITKNNLLKKDLKDINMNGTLIGIRMKINEIIRYKKLSNDEKVAMEVQRAIVFKRLKESEKIKDGALIYYNNVQYKIRKGELI
jgi:hypothetical protein